jgi:hypothetical protein
MLRERECAAPIQDKRGIDFEMGMLGGDVIRVDGDKEIFFLFGIDEVDETPLNEFGKFDLFPCEPVKVLF